MVNIVYLALVIIATLASACVCLLVVIAQSALTVLILVCTPLNLVGRASHFCYSYSAWLATIVAAWAQR